MHGQNQLRLVNNDDASLGGQDYSDTEGPSTENSFVQLSRKTAG
jgi:hypothetical protein